MSGGPEPEVGAGRSLVERGSAEQQVARVHAPARRQAFQPLPAPTGRAPYRLSLKHVLGHQSPRRRVLRLHVIGDTGGVKFPVAQQLVADYMVRDLADTAHAPVFCYHVGDVVYYNGQRPEYYAQFYEPYAHYTPPIVAIPGNHDGDPLDAAVEPSASAFVRTFCATAPEVLLESGDAPRTTMIQPNVFWTLEAPLLTIVGLYTNVPEGGEIEADQVDWLVDELRHARADRALAVALHHPPYSADAHHGGSAAMGATLDNAFTRADRLPDIVLSGHVHNYQRFTRSHHGRQIPYLVVGAGGYWHLHNMATTSGGSAIQTPWAVPGTDVVLDGYAADRHGFLRLAVSNHAVSGEYVTVPRPQESWSSGPVAVADRFTLDLDTYTVTTH